MADSASGWGGWGVNVFEVGRDGRLYVGTGRGVWRTAEAVVPVSAEDEPEPGKPGIELRAYPNPAAGASTVALSLPERAEVRLVVYDMLGRNVTTLHAGALAAGSHEFGFDATGFPAGVYLVRAEVGRQRFTEPFMLVH